MATFNGKVAEVDLTTLEHNLERSLGTIEPDQRFVGRLRKRLIRKPEIELEKRDYMTAYVVAGMGLFFGISAFWMLGQLFKGLRTILMRN